MGVRSIESIARTSQEKAENRGATAQRLLRELGTHRRQLFLGLALVALGAISQAVGPRLIGGAIDRDILGDDPSGLLRTAALLPVG